MQFLCDTGDIMLTPMSLQPTEQIYSPRLNVADSGMSMSLYHLETSKYN